MEFQTLTKSEIRGLLPRGTIRYTNFRSRTALKHALEQLPSHLKTVLQVAVREKQERGIQQELQSRRRRNQERTLRRQAEQANDSRTDHHEFMAIPTEAERRECHAKFRGATSNNGLAMKVCVCCAQELSGGEGDIQNNHALPAINLLRPQIDHPAHILTDGLLLVHEKTYHEGERLCGWFCFDCSRSLKKNTIPRFSLANNMWIGEVPHQLSILRFAEQLLIGLRYRQCYLVKLFCKNGSMAPEHMQRGLRGNVCTYNLNTDAIVQMAEGNLMPRSTRILSEIVAVAFIGNQRIPKRDLLCTFGIRRWAIHEALQWLKLHNPLYRNIHIDPARLQELPEDDIPIEIEANIRYQPDNGLLDRESENYLDGDVIIEDFLPEDDEQEESYVETEERGTVIPLQFVGSSDVELGDIPVNEVMQYALENLQNSTNSETYAVRHSARPASDFGRHEGSNDATIINPLAATFPLLFPYGEGGIEANQARDVSFREHVRWCLRYYDRRFRLHESFIFIAFGILQRREALAAARLQMQRRDFDDLGHALATLTINDLKKAEHEEQNHLPISDTRVQRLRRHLFATSGRIMASNQSRASYRGSIWGTTVIFGPPTIWLTINPLDIHDPIVQVFAGEFIDMDNFDRTAGPDAYRRAVNVAQDPYAASKFFHFIINTILKTLFGINASKYQVTAQKGILGYLSGYFGVVEAQGRGTLHVHMFLWLQNTPNALRIQDLLKTEDFQSKIKAYIKANVRADIDGFTKETIEQIPRVTDLAYSRSPDPSSSSYEVQCADLERKLVRTQQIHVCRKSSCLILRQGVWKCKRHAPFKVAEEDFVTETGEWGPRRTYDRLNNWNPDLLIEIKSNHDIKLLTSGNETRKATWYATMYQTKKQGKSYNLSGAMAKTWMYHQTHSQHLLDIRDRNRLFLFRIFNTINRQSEVSAPLVISYIMGWGDTFKSHSYVKIYWAAMASFIMKKFPYLRRSSRNMDIIEDQAGNEQDDAEQNDNLTFEVSRNGHIIPRSEIVNYQYRGIELENISFLDFEMNTYEETIRTFSVSSRGRSHNIRSYYLPQHPQHEKRWRVIRTAGHNTLPSFVGKWFPRQDNPDDYSFYCASMLFLLKPWRKPHDHINNGATWEASFMEFQSDTIQRNRDIMANIQFYYQCEASAREQNQDDNQDEEDRMEYEREEDPRNNVDQVELTEEDYQQCLASLIPTRERQHGVQAMMIAEHVGIFKESHSSWGVLPLEYTQANNARILLLSMWQEEMKKQAIQTRLPPTGATIEEALDDSNVMLFDMTDLPDTADVQMVTPEIPTEMVPLISPIDLLPDQRRAFDIVQWHLEETLAEKQPPQLLMFITGEPGVGKSVVIQSISELFKSKNVSHLLNKGAYTGLAASNIGGQTTHYLGQIALNGRRPSAKTLKKLAFIWKHAIYFIIDEISMLSRTFFALLSNLIGIAKSNSNLQSTDKPFGGVNVIIVGDFHQFPPVVTNKSAPLYYPSDLFKDKSEAILGRAIYEQFTTVVRLKQQVWFPAIFQYQALTSFFQVRVIDSEWQDLLQHVRYGKCHERHITYLKHLIITNPECPPTNYKSPPWSESILITPRHAVRMQWNAAAIQKHCQRNHIPVFVIPAQDSIKGRPLCLAERIALVSHRSNQRGNKQDSGSLLDRLEIAIGVKVMVTYNLFTDLEVTNGSRGTVIDIILNGREPPFSQNQSVIELQYLPVYLLVKLDGSKIQLNGLAEGVIPVTPVKKSFTITTNGSDSTVNRLQFPITAAYSFTDYRTQGQTIRFPIIDIGNPPSGRLTPFSVYVALSRSPEGVNGVRLLRDFDKRLFTQHPSEYLRQEDERLDKLDQQTRRLWEARMEGASHHS